jgi:hypothetical protein
VLAGRATLADVRRRAAAGARGTRRVRRRDGQTQKTGLSRREWPMTVRDVCAAAPGQYSRTVHAWAVSILSTLDGPLHRF